MRCGPPLQARDPQLWKIDQWSDIVPTAFYRHFDNMEELGLALIDESFRTLRAMIRAARADPRTYEHVIRYSVEILVGYVHEHDSHFRFIARERFGGVAALRHAIRHEIRLFASDLATDLARFPHLDRWSTDDLQLLAWADGRRDGRDRRGDPRCAAAGPCGRGRDHRDRPAPAANDHARRAPVGQPRAAAATASHPGRGGALLERVIHDAQVRRRVNARGYARAVLLAQAKGESQRTTPALALRCSGASR